MGEILSLVLSHTCVFFYKDTTTKSRGINTANSRWNPARVTSYKFRVNACWHRNYRTTSQTNFNSASVGIQFFRSHIMASKKKDDKQEEQVEETQEHVGDEQSTTRRPKKVAAQGKHHRSGPRHRDSRRRGYHHLLTEEGEEDEQLS